MTALRLAGRMAIALASFAVVVTGLAVAAGFIALSIDWEIPPPQEILGPSSVFDRDGRPLARFSAEVERREVPLSAISMALRDAVVAAEDHRFYEHRGVDPIAVLRAVWSNVRSGSVREGGSTLTQQFVKNAYVGDERTLWRKVREAIVSIQLEKELTKDEILEAYLNRVYFGQGAYGAEAAALTYFDKPAAELDLHEGALLASVLPEPSRYNPFTDPEGALDRRNVVLQEMATYGLVTQDRADAAMALPLDLVPQQLPPQGAPYFTEEVRRQLLEAFGPDLVYNGGLIVHTTIDLDLQDELERRMQAHLPGDPAFEPAVAVVDPATGDVLAAWSGRDFGASQVDLALGQDYGRPSGSTFKVFALATALEEGWTLSSTWPAPTQVTINDWSPQGGGCGGRCTLLQATAASVNTVYAQVARDVGAGDFTEMARRLGVTSTLRDDDLTQVLGTASVTPLDMASAMATLANDGIACPARVVTDVIEPDGVPQPPPDPRAPTAEERAAWEARMLGEGFAVDPTDHGRCYRAVDAAVARQVTVALRAVVAERHRAARRHRPAAGRQDRHDQRVHAGLVRRLHARRRAVGHGVPPRRRRPADEPAGLLCGVLRRPAARDDLGRRRTRPAGHGGPARAGLPRTAAAERQPGRQQPPATCRTAAPRCRAVPHARAHHGAGGTDCAARRSQPRVHADAHAGSPALTAAG